MQRPAPAPDHRTLLQHAMEQHGAGRLDAAEATYRDLLADRPDDVDALHLHGVLLAQRGLLDEAAASIARALQLRPEEAMFANNLGNVRVEQGRFQDAETLYRQAVTLDAARLDAQ